MFTYWKTPYESTWGNPRSSDLTDVSPKDFSKTIPEELADEKNK